MGCYSVGSMNVGRGRTKDGCEVSGGRRGDPDLGAGWIGDVYNVGVSSGGGQWT